MRPIPTPSSLILIDTLGTNPLMVSQVVASSWTCL
jgi:hypothetical protein